jgi:hypothetical protein
MARQTDGHLGINILHGKTDGQALMIQQLSMAKQTNR